MDQIERLAQALKESRHLCVFTGAGISVPSGIPAFRSSNGLRVAGNAGAAGRRGDAEHRRPASGGGQHERV